MTATPVLDLRDFARLLLDAIEASEAEYMLGGALAVMAYAEARSTQDIDVVVHSPEDLILYKLRYFAISEQDKHVRDIAAILSAMEDQLEQDCDAIRYARGHGLRNVRKLPSSALPHSVSILSG